MRLGSAGRRRHLRQQQVHNTKIYSELFEPHTASTVGSTVVLVEINAPQLNGKTGIIESVDEQKVGTQLRLMGSQRREPGQSILLRLALILTRVVLVAWVCAARLDTWWLRLTTGTMGGQCLCGRDRRRRVRLRVQITASAMIVSKWPARTRRSGGKTKAALSHWKCFCRRTGMIASAVQPIGQPRWQELVAAKTWAAAVLCKTRMTLKAAEQAQSATSGVKAGRRGSCCVWSRIAMACAHERACDKQRSVYSGCAGDGNYGR